MHSPGPASLSLVAVTRHHTMDSGPVVLHTPQTVLKQQESLKECAPAVILLVDLSVTVGENGD